LAQLIAPKTKFRKSSASNRTAVTSVLSLQTVDWIGGAPEGRWEAAVPSTFNRDYGGPEEELHRIATFFS